MLGVWAVVLNVRKVLGIGFRDEVKVWGVPSGGFNEDKRMQ